MIFHSSSHQFLVIESNLILDSRGESEKDFTPSLCFSQVGTYHPFLAGGELERWRLETVESEAFTQQRLVHTV